MYVCVTAAVESLQEGAGLEEEGVGLEEEGAGLGRKSPLRIAGMRR